jgi:Na+/H+-dicarboxylate symporter
LIELGIALIAGIDRVLDTAGTRINVAGDMAGSVVAAASEGELQKPGVKTASA